MNAQNIKSDSSIHKMSMCGEIYYNDDGCFQYLCCVCMLTLDQASQFELHVVMHLQKERITALEPEIKLEEQTSEDLPIEFVDLPTKDDIGITVGLQIEQYTDIMDIVNEEQRIANSIYPEITIPCDYCDMKFLCDGLKDIHSAQSHAQAKSHSCELCTATFDTKKDYRKHEILHMNFEDPLTCPHCNQLQLDKIHLSLHLNEHLFPLNITGIKSKETPLISPLGKRKPRVACARPFKCPTCKKNYIHLRSSKNCELSHIKDNEDKLSGTLECDTCGKIFDTLTTFKSHIEHHIRKKKNKGRESESMQCDYCQRVYKGYSNFKAHIFSHFYTYKCQFCDRSFNTQSIRAAHEHFHQNERHLCIACGRSFPVRRQLNDHMRRSHNDSDVINKCTLCPLEFTKKNNLLRHIKTHTATRSLQCKECPKKFCTAKTLRQHAILHKGTKPYLCKYCGMGFSQPAGRRGHEKRVHETIK